jgi:hypothetical protein
MNKLKLLLITLILINLTGCSGFSRYKTWDPDYGKCAIGVYFHSNAESIKTRKYLIFECDYLPFVREDECLHINGIMNNCKVFPFKKKSERHDICKGREIAEVPCGRYSFHIPDGMGVWILYGDGCGDSIIVSNNRLSDSYVERIINATR